MHDKLSLEKVAFGSRDLFEFWEKSDILETVQDRDIVAMED